MSQRMEDLGLTSVARAAVVRTSQACQRCRSLKTRCLPSTQSGLCQRCFLAHKECLWADAPRRARRVRVPSRIAQVEQKIDGIMATLVNPISTRPETIPALAETQSVLTIPREGVPRETSIDRSPVAPGSWMAVPSFEQTPQQHDLGIEAAPDQQEADRQYLAKLHTIHNFGDREDIGQTPSSLFQPSKRCEEPIDNELVQNLLSNGEADSLLNIFRKMSASFPFVVLPYTISSQELHASRPMLFLAAITVASSKNHQRQMSLDDIYRRELADRTIIRPRRTLGLVQSVLVYLSWYHFVFSHKTQQIFFLHHLVIGLALDIGLHQDYQPLNFINTPKPPPPSPQDQRERYRAFLGCYYLASMIAAGLQKPNLLKHTTRITEWAHDLMREREYESDETIGHLISLRQIDDQIQDTLFASGALESHLTDARTLMHVRSVEAQLEAWKKESTGTSSRRLLDLSSSFTDMLLHSVALRTATPDQLSASGGTYLTALLSTLEAAKRFLDTMIAFPVHDYHLISFSEWMRLPAVIMTVAKLCMPTDAHATTGWDVKAAQDRVRLDLCLESLCYRMQSLSTYDKRKQNHPDFWYAMRFINDLTKTWYLRKIRPEQQVNTSSEPIPNSQIGLSTSGQSPRTISTPFLHQSGERYTTVAGINYLGDISMDIGADAENDDAPFAFLKDVDIDMEQFFDMGIWGDETYNSMGFGGGIPF